MSRGRWIALVVAVAVVFVAAGVAGVVLASRSSSSSGPALPSSMASAGDSITQAFDLDAGATLRSSPAESWSTGTDPVVDSQYTRIVAAHSALTGHEYNYAVVGAKMAALDGQLQRASAQGVAYVTVLMGANDLCAQSAAAMTPAVTFGAQFQRALTGFFATDPDARVFVASIPNLLQLWQTLQSNLRARIVWGLAHLCPTMLAATDTPAERALVVDREAADNAALAAVCLRFARCRFDGGAVFRQTFSPADISTVDYFHPSLPGQQALASVTWAAGYWPSTR
jgi:lysophospholipase L1-like esterase